jgi:hypothetical protein
VIIQVLSATVSLQLGFILYPGSMLVRKQVIFQIVLSCYVVNAKSGLMPSATFRDNVAKKIKPGTNL